MPPAPVRVPSRRPFTPSVMSVTSVANDEDDNEMILGAVHRSPGICLTAEENPQKTSGRRPSDKGDVRPVIGEVILFIYRGYGMKNPNYTPVFNLLIRNLFYYAMA